MVASRTELNWLKKSLTAKGLETSELYMTDVIDAIASSAKLTKADAG